MLPPADDEFMIKVETNFTAEISLFHELLTEILELGVDYAGLISLIKGGYYLGFAQGLKHAREVAEESM